MYVTWHFKWNGGHYVEWFDGKHSRLAFLDNEAYEELMFDIELS
jgi:hypothetical protein